jgi:hypothetical protein
MSAGVHSCHIQKGHPPNSPKTHVIISAMKPTYVAQAGSDTSGLYRRMTSGDRRRSSRTGQNETFETETAPATPVLFGNVQTFLRPVSFCPVRQQRPGFAPSRLCCSTAFPKMRTLCVQNATKNAHVNFLLCWHQPLTTLTPESVRIFRGGHWDCFTQG